MEIRHKRTECLWGNPTPLGFQMILYNFYIAVIKTWNMLLVLHSLKQAWIDHIWLEVQIGQKNQAVWWLRRQESVLAFKFKLVCSVGFWKHPLLCFVLCTNGRHWKLVLLAEQGMWNLKTTAVNGGLSSEQKQTSKISWTGAMNLIII